MYNHIAMTDRDPPHENSHNQRGRPAGRWSWLFRCVRIALVVYLGLVLLLMFFEESLIFFPSRFPNGNWQPVGIEFEEVEFESGDGTRLHAWHFPHPQPRAHILFCHGNAGHLADRAWLMQQLRDELDVEVFIFDYRGYGKSDGKPNGKGILLDGRAACETFAGRAGIDTSDILPMGRSLGGAVAVDLAVEYGTRGLVLESTFTSTFDMATHYYPFLPVRLLMRTRLDSVAKIRQFQGRLLQSHGDDDEMLRYEMGKQLFSAANDPKTFITIGGGRHNDPQTAEYYTALDEFIDEVSRNS